MNVCIKLVVVFVVMKSIFHIKKIKCYIILVCIRKYMYISFPDLLDTYMPCKVFRMDKEYLPNILFNNKKLNQCLLPFNYELSNDT